MSETQYVDCPFCGDKGYDLVGLKTHFENGWCDVYESVERYRGPFSRAAQPVGTAKAPESQKEGEL